MTPAPALADLADKGGLRVMAAAGPYSFEDTLDYTVCIFFSCAWLRYPAVRCKEYVSWIPWQTMLPSLRCSPWMTFSTGLFASHQTYLFWYVASEHMPRLVFLAVCLSRCIARADGALCGCGQSPDQEPARPTPDVRGGIVLKRSPRQASHGH